MNFRRIKAVFYKEFLDIIRNPLIILMIFMFPILTTVFYFIVSNTPEVLNFIMPTFITMHIIMAPIICFSSVIAEDKEKNTLKVLFMSNVRPFEYLMGIGICLIMVLIISIIPYVLMLRFSMIEFIKFIFLAFIGIFSSSMLGAIIGINAKSQISVGVIASPVSMVLGLIPMISNFNNSINYYSGFLYSKRIYELIFNYRVNGSLNILRIHILIFLINLIVLLILFSLTYNKKKLLRK